MVYIDLSFAKTPMCAASSSKDDPAAAGEISSQPSLRILVVDDLVDAADSLALLLRMLGHEVQTAYDGLSAVQVAQQFKPHAVLLDIGLPRLDGYEVAMRLRRLPELQRVCLIAVSGYGRQDDIDRAHRAGFDDHLIKPVSLDRLDVLLAELAKRVL
jgi:two-component system CheB/CheR fusion protein